MKTEFIMVYEAGTRAQTFLDAEPATAGAAVAAPMRAKLDAALTSFAALDYQQQAARGSVAAEVARVAAFRRELYARFVGPIGKIAKFAFNTSPEYEALVIPARKLRLNDFLTKLDRLVDAAATHEQALIDHTMPADFLSQLRATVEELRQAAGARATARSKQTAATMALNEVVARLRSILNILDATVRVALRNDPPLQGEWIARRKIGKTAVTPNPTASLEDAA